jgi:hypothetical protein
VEIYRNDFEGAVGPEWSDSTTEITPLGRRRFLGKFADDSVSLSLTNLPPHSEIELTFELFVILSWDGNQPIDGEEWQVGLEGGPVLLRTSFSNADELSGIGPPPRDLVVRLIQVNFQEAITPRGPALPK